MVLKFIALGDMGSGEKEQYDVSKGIQHIIKSFIVNIQTKFKYS